MNKTISQVDPDPGTVITSAKIRIPVVACGPTWLVVDKPCGISIHNDPGNDLCSLVLGALRAGRLPAVGHNRQAVHAVHRIDRETSGIVLLATDSKTLAYLGKQFSERKVEKRYLAVVHGRLNTLSRGEWDWPLTAWATGRVDPMGKGMRRLSITHWWILKHTPHYTLVECDPLTGRKHQIRRHAKLAGHPVVGDRRYGSTRSVNFLSQRFDFNRLGLHAHTLTIRLPGDVKVGKFQSAGLPEEMRRLLDRDR